MPAPSVVNTSTAPLPVVSGVKPKAFVSNVPLPGVVVVASVWLRFEPPSAKPCVVIDAPPVVASVTAASMVKLFAPAPAEPL